MSFDTIDNLIVNLQNTIISFEGMDLWPKIYPILYAFLKNSTTHITIPASPVPPALYYVCRRKIAKASDCVYDARRPRNVRKMYLHNLAEKKFKWHMLLQTLESEVKNKTADRKSLKFFFTKQYTSEGWYTYSDQFLRCKINYSNLLRPICSFPLKLACFLCPLFKKFCYKIPRQNTFPFSISNKCRTR